MGLLVGLNYSCFIPCTTLTSFLLTPLPQPPASSHPLTLLSEHSPASYPTGCETGQLHIWGWEADRDNGGGEVHRQMQLTHGNVTPKGVKSLKV